MKDYFELFNLSKNFDIDMADLESKYIRACMSSHPDHLHYQNSYTPFFSAAELSLAQLNEAYKTLKNPVTRAEHLLLIYGESAGNEVQTVSEGFLEEVIDLREKMTNLNSPSDLYLFEDLINHKIEKSIGQLALLFDAPLNSKTKKLLRVVLNEISYLQSLKRDFFRQSE